jgi:hypothetical protein
MSSVAYMREWRKSHPGYSSKYVAAWKKRNHEKNLISMKKDREKHREARLRYAKEYHLRTLYGLSVDDFLALYNQQNGKCAICFDVIPNPLIEETNSKTHVDHCHVTGKIRGLLCFSCNKLLGDAKDNPQILVNAIRYLGGK